MNCKRKTKKPNAHGKVSQKSRCYVDLSRKLNRVVSLYAVVHVFKPTVLLATMLFVHLTKK